MSTSPKPWGRPFRLPILSSRSLQSTRNPSSYPAGTEASAFADDPYGPPSISDSDWNLFRKAKKSDNQKLIAYLQVYGGEINRNTQQNRHIPVSPLPGSECTDIPVPRDILPGSLD